jgi:regulatory protein YycI of two-component signal transduction system YycFG
MKKSNNSKNNWIIFVVVLLIVAVFFSSYYYSQLKEDEVKLNDYLISDPNPQSNTTYNEAESQESSCNSCEQNQDNREEAQSVLDQFQSFQTDRSASRVLSMMTEPETANEENDLAALQLGISDGEQIYRLYSANELTFDLTNYEITKTEKIDDNEYWFYITETRKLWDQTTGDWGEESYQLERKFEIIKVGSDWMVGKYTTNEGISKYDGFSNVNKL